MNDYPGVMTDDEEEEKSAYPPVRTMPQPNARQQIIPPANAEPDLGGMSMPPVDMGPREPSPPPRPSEYAPIERHGWGRIGQVANDLFTGQSGRDESRQQERASAATKNYDTQLKQGQEQRESTAKISHEAAQGEHEQATAEATREGMKNVTILGPNGTTYSVPQKDAEKLMGTIAAQEGATGRENSREKSQEGIAGGKNKTAEEIARGKAESAERIATGHNLAQTEIARIRADAANDPNKLTNTMKTMKQQAQATLPRIATTLDETERIAGMLGPVEGRWNEFMTGKIGAGDPKFKHYLDEVGMVQSAVTLAHARGRMSDSLFKHFEKMFDAGQQTAENMIQALTVAQEWLTDYANMGEPGSPVGNKPMATGSGASSGDIYARDPQGKLHKAAAGTALPKDWKQEKR